MGSYLRYGIGSWGSCSATLFDEIKSAQNKIVKALLFLPYTADATSGYSQLGMLRVEDIYKLETIKLVHSIYHKYCPSAFSNFLSFPSHTYSTRLKQNQCFSLSKPRTNLGKRSLKFSGVKIWSELSQNIKMISEKKKMSALVKELFLN